jgi:hypothetical protein
MKSRLWKATKKSATTETASDPAADRGREFQLIDGS